MEAFERLAAARHRPLLFSCEHASCVVPPAYDNLGVASQVLREHIGWDIGAGDLTRALAAKLGSPAILSTGS